MNKLPVTFFALTVPLFAGMGIAHAETQDTAPLIQLAQQTPDDITRMLRGEDGGGFAQPERGGKRNAPQDRGERNEGAEGLGASIRSLDPQKHVDEIQVPDIHGAHAGLDPRSTSAADTLAKPTPESVAEVLRNNGVKLKLVKRTDTVTDLVTKIRGLDTYLALHRVKDNWVIMSHQIAFLPNKTQWADISADKINLFNKNNYLYRVFIGGGDRKTLNFQIDNWIGGGITKAGIMNSYQLFQAGLNSVLKTFFNL